MLQHLFQPLPELIFPRLRYRSEVCCLPTPAPRLEIGERSAAGAARQPGTTLEADLRQDRVMETGYGITDHLRGVNQRVTKLATTHGHFRGQECNHEAHVRTLEAHVATLIAQTSSLQTQLTTSLGRIKTLEARDPEPQDEPAEGGSSCTEGVVRLTQWAVGHDVAYAMPWKTLKKMMTDKYCPIGVGIVCDESFPEEIGCSFQVRLRIRGSLRTPLETTKTNNSHSKETMWHGLILLGLVRRNRTEESNLCAPNETITMMGCVLPSALTAKGLAIRLVTVKTGLLLPTTTKELRDQTRVLTSFGVVELRVIIRSGLPKVERTGIRVTSGWE
ncbi:hypothetical protein Tco_0211369 [Tanacetum coccineum]